MCPYIDYNDGSAADHDDSSSSANAHGDGTETNPEKHCKAADKHPCDPPCPRCRAKRIRHCRRDLLKLRSLCQDYVYEIGADLRSAGFDLEPEAWDEFLRTLGIQPHIVSDRLATSGSLAWVCHSDSARRAGVDGLCDKIHEEICKNWCSRATRKLPDGTERSGCREMLDHEPLINLIGTSGEALQGQQERKVNRTFVLS